MFIFEVLIWILNTHQKPITLVAKLLKKNLNLGQAMDIGNFMKDSIEMQLLQGRFIRFFYFIFLFEVKKGDPILSHYQIS